MANNTIAKAYVQLVASADGISDSISKAMGAAGEDGGKKFSSGFANFLKGAGAVTAAAIGAASTAVTALTKQSIDAYADFEQLTGGVETLFGAGGQSIAEYAASMGESIQNVAAEYSQMMKAQNDVMDNASNAFKTAGLSANEYMETVTGFSASLIQSLGGDTVKAAEVADMAIIDMSDNANKMGTSMESIQNAYQGFAKQNYTMLDNLKLGYGGTKEEMKRLLSDATALSGVEYDLESFSDISEAIHVIQTNLGITGTTAKEASSTISGSVGQMKASWENLITGIADPEADLSVLIDNFVDSTLTMVENLAPAIQNALGGIGQLVEGLAPIIAEQLPVMITEVLPNLISAVETLISGVVDALPVLIPFISSMAVSLVSSLSEFLINNLPQLLLVSLEAIETLARGIGESLPTLIPDLVGTIIFIVSELTSPESIQNLLGAALTLILGLAQGLIAAIPDLLFAIPEIIGSLIASLISFVPQIAVAGVELLLSLIENLPAIILGLTNAVPQIIAAIVRTFSSPEFRQQFSQVGVRLLEGLSNGITSFVPNLIANSKAAMNQVIKTVKDTFKISSPSKIFYGFGRFIDMGMANGIVDNIGLVDNAMGEMVDAANIESEISAQYSSEVAPSAFQIVVNAAEGQSEESIAQKVSEIIANQYTRERAVYA